MEEILRQMVMDLREYMGHREVLIRDGMDPDTVDRIIINGIEDDGLLQRYVVLLKAFGR